MATFDERLTGLLGDPTFNLGVGLLGASGPSFQPQSFGNSLARGSAFAQQRQMAQMQNEAARQALADRSKRREAMTGLQGLLQPGQTPGPVVNPTPAPITQPGGQQQALGLLMEAFPDQVGSQLSGGLLGQMFPEPERAETSLVRNVRALSDPTLTEEQREIIRTNVAGDPGVTDEQLRMLDAQLKGLQIQNVLNEQQQAKTDERQTQAELAGSFRQDIKDARRLAELNNRLRDTVLETGVPLSDARRAVASGAAAVKALLGTSDAETQRVIADFDEFNKTSTRFASQTAARLFSQGGLSNFQLETAQNQTPSSSLSPIANNRIIADTLETLLSGANVAGVSLNESEIEEVNSFIQTLRELEAPANGNVIDEDDFLRSLPE